MAREGPGPDERNRLPPRDGSKYRWTTRIECPSCGNEQEIEMSDTKSVAESLSAGAESAVGTNAASTRSRGERDNVFDTMRIDQLSDVGVDEAHSGAMHDQTRSWNANVKRTYDVHQSWDSKVWSDLQGSHGVRDNIINQALQNAVETANMVGKQAVRHGDIAIDRQWNVDEVSTLTAKSGVEADAVVAALIAALTTSINK